MLIFLNIILPLKEIEKIKCEDFQIEPFIIGTALEDIKEKDYFKGKIENSNYEKFQIIKKEKYKKFIIMQIIDVKDNFIFDGFLFIGKKNKTLLGYDLWIKVSNKNFLKEFYEKLGKADLDIRNQGAPNRWKGFDEIFGKNWTLKEWIFTSCNLRLRIQEMPINNPDSLLSDKNF